MSGDFDPSIALLAAAAPAPPAVYEVWPGETGPAGAIRLPALSVGDRDPGDAVRDYAETHRTRLVTLFERAQAERLDLLLRCSCPPAREAACGCELWLAAVESVLLDWVGPPQRAPSALTAWVRAWRSGEPTLASSLWTRAQPTLRKLRQLAGRVLRQRAPQHRDRASSLLHRALVRVAQRDDLRSAQALAKRTIRGEALAYGRREKRRELEAWAHDLALPSEPPSWARAVGQDVLAEIGPAYAEFERRLVLARPREGPELLAVIQQLTQAGVELPQALAGLTHIRSLRTLQRLLDEVVRPLAHAVFGPLFANASASEAELVDELLRWLRLPLDPPPPN